MARRRSRIAQLRAPFVVTVAMGASACGGVAASGERAGTHLTGTDGGLTQGDAETHACPAAFPAYGTPCSYVGDTCVYASVNACGGGTATCQGGQWDARADIGGCNPPAPPPVFPAGPCPTVAPIAGAPCMIAPSTTCSQLATCSQPGFEATCYVETWSFVPVAAGQWQVKLSYMACNPPPPTLTDAGLVDVGPPTPTEDAGPARD